MASAFTTIVPRSYDDDEEEETESNNIQRRSPPLACSFCDETFTSPTVLSQHLLSCGNKTDQCPNCYKWIRRSHFAYHYENNCAPIDRVETPPPPPPRPKARSALHPSTNLNKPYSREDVPHENYSPRANDRFQSPKSTPRDSPVIVECDFCHQRCAQNDYKTHRDNCLRNPSNANNKPSQLTRVVLGSNKNQNNSNGIVHVPCEICNEPIDLPNWAQHTQNCRERDRQRISKRAQSMSEEPVTEKLPCEYCQQLYSAQQLEPHEYNCPNNPANANQKGRNRHRQSSKSASLPTRSKNDRNRANSADGRSRVPAREVQYQSIDIDRTHEANRSFDGGRRIEPRNINQNPMRRSSDDLLRNMQAYEREPKAGNRPRPLNVNLPRRKPSSDNLRNIEGTGDPNGRAAGGRSPQFRSGRATYEVINNHPDRPLTRKNEKPSFIKSLFCGGKQRVEND